MGLFKTEIVPVKTTVLDNQGNQKTVTVHQDEGIRPSTTLEGLAKLKPAFKEDGSTTAGQLCCSVCGVPVGSLPTGKRVQAKKVLIDLFQQVTPARSVMEQLLFSWQNAQKQHSWGCQSWGCSGPLLWLESRPTSWA